MTKSAQNFSPNPEESNRTGEPAPEHLRTTGQVVDRLQRLKLPASLGSIARDTEEHYLPPRPTAHAGRHGATGLWEPWMEQRAERLYRLRALDRKTNRGPSGDVLRLLLMLKDGWGYENVKDVCVEGYRRMARGTTRGVANRVRKPLTPDMVPFFAEDIAADQYRPNEPTPEQVQRIAFTLNVTLFGMDPGTGMGTLDSIMAEAVGTDRSPEELAQWNQWAPLMRTIIDPSAENMTRWATEASSESVSVAVKEFAKDLYFMRRFFHRKFGKAAHAQGCSSNPLSFFRMARHMEFAKVFRNAPVRITPAQVLGFTFVTCLGATHRMTELGRLADGLLPHLPMLLASAAKGTGDSDSARRT